MRGNSIYDKVQENDIEMWQNVFNSFDNDKKGTIDIYDLKTALEEVGITFSHPNVYYKMISDMKERSGKITFSDFKKIVVQKRKNSDGESDALEAYVALGGDEDGGGNIDADQLINIIKNEFEMTIDIEGLIKQIDTDGSGEIEFDEFVTLLENQGDNPEIATFKDWFMLD